MTETLEDLSLKETTGYVLGNGPSLKEFDFHNLTPFSSIGMNAAYRHWDRIGWRPTHYACLDLVVGLSHIDGIRRLIHEGREGAPSGAKPIEQFLLRSNLIEALGSDGDDDRVINFDVLRQRTPLLQINPLTTGSHALLWAHLMGFRPIILMGIDGNYKEIVEGAVRREGVVLEITEQKSNPNYFFEDYQRPGDRYNVPNPTPELHASAWRRAALELGEQEAVAANGNPMSSVRVFPFVDVPKLLETGSAPLAPADGGGAPPKSLWNVRSALKKKSSRKRAAAVLIPLAVAALGGIVAALGLVSLAIFLLGLLSAVSVSLLIYLLRLARPRGRSSASDLEDMRYQLLEIQRQMRILRRDTKG